MTLTAFGNPVVPDVNMYCRESCMPMSLAMPSGSGAVLADFSWLSRHVADPLRRELVVFESSCAPCLLK